MVQRRKKSHAEGLATRGDPESCGPAQEGRPEALTGALAGRPLSREETPNFQVPSLFRCDEGNTGPTDKARWCGTCARSKNPSMRGSTMYENRETLDPPTTGGVVGRGGKSKDASHRCTGQGV
jgi:hypothetical protein